LSIGVNLDLEVRMGEHRALRADARRNMEKLLDAARDVFSERGLGAPLEAVAARAGVSIGTLYNRFSTREALIDAALPELVACQMAAVADHALAQPTPWARFAAYLEGLCALQSGDHAISDVIAGSQHNSAALSAACDESLVLGARLLAEAQADGSLRDDVTFVDVFVVYWLNARLSEHAGPEAGAVSRRHIAILLDGLRTDAATPLPADPADVAAAVAHLLQADERDVGQFAGLRDMDPTK
jgi:AcrR family transcriptional regulator